MAGREALVYTNVAAGTPRGDLGDILGAIRGGGWEGTREKRQRNETCSFFSVRKKFPAPGLTMRKILAKRKRNRRREKSKGITAQKIGINSGFRCQIRRDKRKKRRGAYRARPKGAFSLRKKEEAVRTRM